MIHALRAGKRKAPVHGILQLDVTTAHDKLAEMDPPGSLTAYIVSAVAQAAGGHPSVHSYRDWRGRLVAHQYVDIATMFEVLRPDGPVPMAHTIRDADVRSVADITTEIRAVKANPRDSASGRWLSAAVPWAGRIPGLMPLFYRVLGVSTRARKMSGTVAVTSVGMFAGGSGVGIGQPTIHSLSVVVGGLSWQPMVVAGEIVARRALDLTVSVDHNVVDGAPAARFVADLRELVESAAGLD